MELDEVHTPITIGEKVWDEEAKKYTYVTQDYEKVEGLCKEPERLVLALVMFIPGVHSLEEAYRRLAQALHINGHTPHLTYASAIRYIIACNRLGYTKANTRARSNTHGLCVHQKRVQSLGGQMCKQSCTSQTP